LLLDEICKILAAKGLSPAELFKILLKTFDGELTFGFGNTLIQLEHTKVPDLYSIKATEDFTNQDIIEISISTTNGLTEKILTHLYRPNELTNMIKLSNQKTKEQTAQKPKQKKKPKQKQNNVQNKSFQQERKI
jgi:hypothetical protein